jgi:hypothetical protein
MSTFTPSFWGQYVFTVGVEEFRWIDVAIAAMARGDWPEFERRLAEGVSSEARALAEHAMPTADVLDQAAAAFRYERDLISGDELSGWLEHEELSVDEWMGFVTRDFLRRLWTEEIEDVLDQYPPSSKRLHEVAVTDGICSGVLASWEMSFSGRAALTFAERPDALGRGEPDRSMSEAAAGLIRLHAHWLGRPDDGGMQARVARIIEIENACAVVCASLATDAALQAMVSANRMDWVQVDLDVVELDTETAAREAMLCVREDGASLYDVAALARRQVERKRCFLGDLPEETRERLLSTEPGRVLGPVPGDSRFEVSAVTMRLPPTLEDAEVAARARSAIEEQAQRRAAREHVQRTPRSAGEEPGRA